MNEFFELRKNSKLYKLLYFFSNFFFTDWLVGRYSESPTSRLYCLESVCSLISTLFKLTLYLIVCALTLFYGIKNLFIFDPRQLTDFNVFSYMGFILKYVVSILLVVVVLVAGWMYLLDLLSKLYTKVVSIMPKKGPIKLLNVYFTDKSKGICRRIEIVDDKEE